MRDAHALDVLFRRYLRSRGLCDRAFDLATATGAAPDSPMAYLLFLEWISERPDIGARVEFVERHYPAAVAQLNAQREARYRR